MTETVAKQYVENEKLINEEYKIWKKTVPLLYDTVHSFALSTSSLTVTPLNDVEVSSDGNDIQAKFLIGTHYEKKENNVELWSASLPSTLSMEHASASVPIPAGPALNAQFERLKKWTHAGDVVNNALNPSSNAGFATMSNSGGVKLWNMDNDESRTLECQGGCCMEFSNDGEQLIIGFEDGSVKLWDVNDLTAEKKQWKYHETNVNDFAWNSFIPSLFASVSDDMSIGLVDLRTGDDSPLLHIKDAHKDSINCVDFNPQLEHLYVTGSADNVVNVWDLRQPMTPLRSLYGHNGSITKVKFNPVEPNILGSAATDRRVHIWDLERMDEEFDVDDYIKADKEDPCLKFIHGGHTGRVTDFNWLPKVYNTVVSVGEDGLVEVWKPHYEESEEEQEEEEEEAEGDGDEKMEE